MKLRKLDSSFYPAHTHLEQALDNIDGKWIENKTRGYGIAVVEIKGLTFAIPLRSCINHKAAYLTVTHSNKGNKKGLDFSKALLIRDNSYISNEIYKIDKEEHKKLQGKEKFITDKFNKYIARYIDAVNKSDKNILHSQEYRYTTLRNYHIDLGLIKK